MRSLPLYAVSILLAGSVSPACAATLYKCLDPAGKAVYADRPCEGRAAGTIQVAALPTRADDGVDAEDAAHEGEDDEPMPEPEEESDAQRYARKVEERRAEEARRRQAAAALPGAQPSKPPVKRP